MDLKSAMRLATDYTTKEGPTSHVILTPGRVTATTGTMGVVIPCDTVTVTATVEAAPLRKMVDVIGPDAQLTTTAKQLKVEGGGAKYRMKLVPPSGIPQVPPPPADGWAKVPGPVLNAITMAAAVVDVAGQGNASLAGLRFTPEWIGGSCTTVTAIVWQAGVVAEKFTAHPGMFKHAQGDGDLAVDGKRMWLRLSDHMRWTQGLQLAWPDDAMQSAIAAARQSPNRITVAASASDLVKLCKHGAVVASTKADVWELLVEGTAVKLSGGSDTNKFDGEIVCTVRGGHRARVGVSAIDLQKAALAATVNDGEQFLSAGDPNSPIMLWGSSQPVVEVAVLPVYLPNP